MSRKIGLIIFTLAFGIFFPLSSHACSIAFGFWSESPSLSSIRRPVYKFNKVIAGEVIPLFGIIRSPLPSHRSGTVCGGSVSLYIKPGQLDFHEDVLSGLLIEHVSGDAPEYVNYFLNQIVMLHDNHITIPIRHYGDLTSSFDIHIRLSAVDREGRFSKPSEPFRLYHDHTKGKTIIQYQSVENQNSLLKEFLIAAENIDEKILSSRIDLGISSELVDAESLIENVDLDTLKKVSHDISGLSNSYDKSLKAYFGMTDLNLPPVLISPAVEDHYRLITEFTMLISMLKVAIEIGDSTFLKNAFERKNRIDMELRYMSLSNPLTDEYPAKLVSARQALKHEFSD